MAAQKIGKLKKWCQAANVAYDLHMYVLASPAPWALPVTALWTNPTN